MNTSKFLASYFLATAFAFAQFPWEVEPAAASSSSEEVSYQPAPSSSSVETKTDVPKGKTIFDVLRGNAYNPYSTVGAALTVEDLVTTPSYINGQKFFYISPTDQLGYTAFGFGSGSVLLGLDNSRVGDLAALILGYANSNFGVALNYSVAKTFTSTDGNQTTSTRTTLPGDNIGLYFSMPIGSSILYANATWLTYGLSRSIDVGGDETEDDYSEIQSKIGLINNTGSFSYDGYLNVIRTGGSHTNANGDKSVENNSYIGLALNFDIGYSALQSSNARVIVGANNRLVAMFYDKIKTNNNNKGDNIEAIVISPNILAEVSLFENWLAFAGATHAINLIAGGGAGSATEPDRNDKFSRLDIVHTDETSTFAGVRYQKPNWAVEAQVTADTFNNPFGGFSGEDVLIGFGGFVYF